MENKPSKSEHKSAKQNMQRAKNAWDYFYGGSQVPYAHVLYQGRVEEPGDELLEAMLWTRHDK